jgi:hypothetical protein
MTYKDHPSQWYMRKSASENGMWPFDVVDGDKNIEFEGDPLLFISGTWSSGAAAPYPNNPAANQDNGDVLDGPLALIYSEKGFVRSDNPTISNMKNENNGIYVFLKLPSELPQRDTNVGTEYTWDSTTYTLTGTTGGDWHETNYSFQTISNEYKGVSFKVLTPGNRTWSVGLSSYPLSSDGYTLNNSNNAVDSNAYINKEFYQFHVNGSNSLTASSPLTSDSIDYIQVGGGSVDLFDDKHLSIITVPSENKVYFYIDAVKVQEYTTTYTGDWYICAQMHSDTTLQFTTLIGTT